MCIHAGSHLLAVAGRGEGICAVYLYSIYAAYRLDVARGSGSTMIRAAHEMALVRVLQDSPPHATIQQVLLLIMQANGLRETA